MKTQNSILAASCLVLTTIVALVASSTKSTGKQQIDDLLLPTEREFYLQTGLSKLLSGTMNDAERQTAFKQWLLKDTTEALKYTLVSMQVVFASQEVTKFDHEILEVESASDVRMSFEMVRLSVAKDHEKLFQIRGIVIPSDLRKHEFRILERQFQFQPGDGKWVEVQNVAR